jgi:hypothetical protein
MPRLARELGRQRLERHRAAEPGVRRQVNTSHSAASELAQHRVRAQDLAWLERVLLGEQLRRRLGYGLSQKLARPGMVIEKRPDLFADHRIIRGNLVEPAADISRIALDRRFEEIARAPTLFGGHVLASAAMIEREAEIIG